MSVQPLEILLVEDNDDDVLLTQEAFRNARLANLVHVLRDGQEALRYLRKQAPYEDARRPGLVLLDINMPRMNGFEVLDEMKRDEALRTVPVVFLTTSGRDEDVVRAYASGACTYVRKPVRFDSFANAIENFSTYWALVAEVPGYVKREPKP